MQEPVRQLLMLDWEGKCECECTVHLTYAAFVGRPPTGRRYHCNYATQHISKVTDEARSTGHVTLIIAPLQQN